VIHRTVVRRRKGSLFFCGAKRRNWPEAPDHVLMANGRYRSRSGHVRTSALIILVENDPSATLGAAVAEVHDRAPVILAEKDFEP
jgi:putative SOS response-associated peptidase YedK